LMAEGAYYRQAYTVQTADPSNRPGPWADYHTSSIPNPVLLAGTAMLIPGKQRYVQESFFPLKITAHAVDEISYRSLNVGFHLTAQYGGQRMVAAGQKEDDANPVFWATQFVKVARPTFLLIHLQDTGRAGGRSGGNIWAEGSPYIKAIVQQDAYLGQFVEMLKKEGIWEKTVMFITGDHGQQAGGGHPLDADEAWAMPLVVVGPGIKKGQKFDYAESIDVVPTLCHLMGVKPPINADGRILAEALVNPPNEVTPRQQKIKEIDYQLLEVGTLLDKLKAAPGAADQLRNFDSPLSQADRDYFRIERILEWYQFGTYDRLIAHHKELLQRLTVLSRASSGGAK
jgi:hypothetical protein